MCSSGQVGRHSLKSAGRILGGGVGHEREQVQSHVALPLVSVSHACERAAQWQCRASRVRRASLPRCPHASVCGQCAGREYAALCVHITSALPPAAPHAAP